MLTTMLTVVLVALAGRLWLRVPLHPALPVAAAAMIAGAAMVMVPSIQVGGLGLLPVLRCSSRRAAGSCIAVHPSGRHGNTVAGGAPLWHFNTLAAGGCPMRPSPRLALLSPARCPAQRKACMRQGGVTQAPLPLLLQGSESGGLNSGQAWLGLGLAVGALLLTTLYLVELQASRGWPAGRGRLWRGGPAAEPPNALVSSRCPVPCLHYITLHCNAI